MGRFGAPKILLIGVRRVEECVSVILNKNFLKLTTESVYGDKLGSYNKEEAFM